MRAQDTLLPSRRDALPMISASAAVLVAPLQVLAQPKTPIVTTKTRFAGPLSELLIKTISARREYQGFLSQKVLENADSVVLIEEWRGPMTRGAETFYRKEI
jgi:hypothetical protein